MRPTADVYPPDAQGAAESSRLPNGAPRQVVMKADGVAGLMATPLSLHERARTMRSTRRSR